MALAQAHCLGRHLDQFVLIDIGDGLFQRHDARRGEAHGLVLAGGADVGQLLALDRVDVEVIPAAVLADDHALIGLFARAHEHDAAILEVPQGEGGGFAVRVGEQHALEAAGDLALVRLIVAEDAVQHARAARIRQEFALVADQRARGAHQADAGLAGTRR